MLFIDGEDFAGTEIHTTYLMICNIKDLSQTVFYPDYKNFH